ncbi:GNAT family acetyltransferase [Brachionus plicatilis]|uniref:GNAT family acetyltransferase n=1 Tax=Brachionus plicatilis TaxID=10195 RepID=A0A3M7RSM6_BRAPC|nr:GNAT family acetyltransferase [Brachionus plicatilis]
MISKIITIESKVHIDIISELNHNRLENIDNNRLLNDLTNQFFNGFFMLRSNPGGNLTKDDVDAYVLFYNSYSSWQNRTIHLIDLWFRPTLNDSEKFSILKDLKSKLFEYARENYLNRVNYHLVENEKNKKLISWIQHEKLGALNLSKLEDWLIYEMDLEGMKNFISIDSKMPENYKIIKVDDINQFCMQIHDLIHEISIFEKMEDQFKLSVEGLTRDYNYLDEKKLNRFYETMIVLNDKDEVVGYTIYYKIYELKRGVGCYLEDLYIQEKYRRKGLGGALWKKLVKDCLEKFRANFMQWTVLAWNTPAIDFYHKSGAKNLENLSLFRFPTNKIYH